MNIINFLFSWDWCSGEYSFGPVFRMVKEILNILRIVVPIALIAMTSFKKKKKVIDPNEKDGQKKIMIRAIAALIVFLVPTMIRLTFKVIDWGRNVDGSYANAESGLSKCWR